MKLKILLFRIISYLTFYLKSDTLFHIHSPFIFELSERVLDSNERYYFFGKATYIRNQLLHDKTRINHTDYGAKGLQEGKASTRTVKDFASSSLSSVHQSELLFRLIAYLKPRKILELGTNLGLNALYFKSAGGISWQVHTVEGSPGLASYAETLFEKYRANIFVHKGRFQKIVPDILTEFGPFDFYYIDGDHTYAATIRLFEMLATTATAHTVIVIDDIYWSPGMNRAWKEIIQDKRVTLSIDVYDLGLLFFRKDFGQKVHKRIIGAAKKPWQKFLPG